MREALQLAVTTAFNLLGFQCVTLQAHPDNLASIRVAWRCGFRFGGILRGIGMHQDQREDRAMATLLPGDPLEPATSWTALMKLLQQSHRGNASD